MHFCEKGDIILDINITSDFAKSCAQQYKVYAFVPDPIVQELKQVANIHPYNLISKTDSLIDELPNISLMNVNVSNTNSMLYGAKYIIKRDRPIIIFPKHPASHFDIFDYCETLNYDRVLFDKQYVLFPNNKDCKIDNVQQITGMYGIPKSYLVFIPKQTGGSVDYEPYSCDNKNILANLPSSYYNEDGSPKYAYCTLLMIDDSYLPGVLTLGYSIKLTRTQCDLIVMVTHEISKYARDLLLKVYNKVIDVEYIIPSFGLIKTHLVKKYPHYGKTFTKLNLLSFDQYEKIMFLDADSLVLKIFDTLFTLPCPAAVYYGTHKMHENNYKPRLKGDKYSWHAKYCKCCGHGKRIPPNMLDVESKKESLYGMSTECMLLAPDKKKLESILKQIHDKKFLQEHKDGFLSDAGYITYTYRNEWTGMDPRFLGRRGYPRIEELFGITLGGSKPWELQNVKYVSSYPDYQEWYKYFLEMISQLQINNTLFNQLKKVIMEKKIIKHVSIKIILPNDSGGLKQDAQIFKHYFEKNLTNTTVTILGPNDKETINKHSDVNLFLESISDKFVDYVFMSNYNMFMVNQEFFDYPHLVKQLSLRKNKPQFDFNKKIDLFLCKTMCAMKFLEEVEMKHKTKLRKLYTKFTTFFIKKHINKNYNQFLHSAGSSTLKSTDVVVNTWNTYNITNDLVMTCYDRCAENLKKYADVKSEHITMFTQRQHADKIIMFANEIGNHICPSMIEGFGHYINQARYTSSVVLTVNAEPMNELVDRKSGILIEYSKKIARKNGSFMYAITEAQLYEGIQQMLKLTNEERAVLGQNARLRYESDTIFFEDAMEKLCLGLQDLQKN